MPQNRITAHFNLIRKYILIVGFWLFALTVLAQTQRPKIGLVLSGGGAKGVAHIGILKAMEEAGLTPDYITGTSMGSIVGGMYAAGYSADELKQIIETADWGMLLSNKMPFNKVTYEEKPYYGRFLVDFNVVGGEVKLPKGIIEGQALMELFTNLTRHVHDIEDFKDLPIPFACIGADITTGEKVVLNRGSLAQSMRASMSIPSIFTPVKIGEHYLVDGGLVHNMPVTEIQEMGADIVIGVFVGMDLLSEEELNSPISILTQSAFIASAFDARKELAKCDLLIQPNLEGYTTGSFNEAKEILERGAEAGKAYYPIFKKLADSLRALGPMHQVVRPPLSNEYIFQKIIVDGTKYIDPEFIIGKFEIKPGKPVSIDHIQKRLELIYGTLYFEKLTYEINGPPDSLVLKVNVVERPKGQLRFSYHYDSENKGGIVANATFRNTVLNRSRLVLEADLASYPRTSIDYFKYLGRRQNLGLQLLGSYQKNEFPIYDSLGNVNYLFSSNYTTATFRFQTTLFQNGAIGLEARYNDIRIKPKIAESSIRTISKIDYTNTYFSLYYRFNNWNERYFPTRGIKAEFKVSATTKPDATVVISDTLILGPDQLGSILETENIASVDLTLFPIIPVGDRFSILAKMRLKVSTLDGDKLNLADYDFVGGFIPGWVNANEYFGGNAKEYQLANYFYGRLSLQYQMKPSLYLQGHFNYINSNLGIEDVQMSKLGDRTNRFGYGASLGLNSPLGPLIFAFAKDHFRKDWKATLVIGFYY